MLHVTNGDSAADLIARTGLAGRVLPWRDALHEGPVPEDLDAEQLATVRARFLAASGGGAEHAIAADFTARDLLLEESASGGDPILLWFESDLYDQLQLVQMLDRLGAAAEPPEIALVEPGGDPFVGLAELDPDQLQELYERRRRLGRPELDLAVRAWAAFRSPDPRGLVNLVREGSLALRFLGAALVRHLEQFPSERDGLGRSERTLLEAVAGGARRPAAAFAFQHEREERPFLGDTWAWAHLDRLAAGPAPLLIVRTAPSPSGATSPASKIRS